jgi:hypothetical protein
VHREVVEHDDVPRLQRRHQDLLDIREKRRVVDRAVEDGGRDESVNTEAGDDGVGLPMAVGRVVAEPDAARTPPVSPQEIRGHPGFVDEDVRAGVVERLRVLPASTIGGDVRASLLVGVYRFF